jgi:hypothetical protein
VSGATPDPAGHSFREIDAALGLPKGSSFRAFRRMESELVEGRDFVLLHRQRHAPLIEGLREQGRIYPGSINVVLVGDPLRQRIERHLARKGDS